MSNVLEYTLSLRDQLSSRLRNIGVNSDSALNKFAKLQQQAQQVNKNLRDLGTSASTLQGKLQLLRNERDILPESSLNRIRTYNREIQNLEGRITRLQTVGSGGGMLRDAFQSIPFAGMLTNPLVAGGIIAAKAIHAGIQDEFIGTSFEVLLKSKDEGKALFEDITKYADNTSYQKMGLGESAKMMLGFGIAQEKIMPNLKMLGDVAMGNAEKMSSLTLAFSQVSAAGRLTGQDNLQFVAAGFNPLMIISQKTGKSMSQLRDEMEKGLISTAMVEDAFKTATSEGGLFYGMADKMSKTLGGRLSTLWDKIIEKLVAFYNIISPILIPAVNGLIWAIDGIANGLGWVMQQINEGNPWLIGLASLIGSVTIAMVAMKLGLMAQSAWLAITTVATNLFSKAWWKLNYAMLANPLTWLIALIIGLVAYITYVILSVKDWTMVWDNSMKFMKGGLAMFASGFKLIWLSIRNDFMNSVDNIKRSWYMLTALWDKKGAATNLNNLNSAAAKRMSEYVAEKKQMEKSAAETLVAGKMAYIGINNRKSFQEVLGDVKKNLGIADPKDTPGTKKDEEGALAGGGGGSNLAKTNQGIATGGSKSTTIQISMKSMVEQIKVSGSDFKEATENMTEQMQDAFLRMLAMAQATAG